MSIIRLINVLITSHSVDLMARIYVCVLLRKKGCDRI